MLFMASPRAGVRRRADITITIGNSGNIYGYDTGLVIGSLSSDTYIDRTGTTRTIEVIAEDQTGAPSPGTTGFSLNGNSIPDTDQTFQYIVVNGVKLVRSNATYNGADGGNSTWSWSTAQIMDTSGTDPLEVWA